ncbi:hypothetical protein CYMTET_49083 [Cymbomonas tetramitiformis]|uniref:EamA domain-containing protein n=1 Tax=Cymbomonas tetramitiformis TaxID=36881 RepID=A0AAE0BQT8_9CHLO|nr:hypothetical protein CYMTET_49083 [Cymbomonas tetramitiformis]
MLPVMVSLVCICAAATAAPITGQEFGGVSLDRTTVVPGRAVGGAVSDYVVLEEFASTPWTPSIDTTTLPTTISGSAARGVLSSLNGMPTTTRGSGAQIPVTKIYPKLLKVKTQVEASSASAERRKKYGLSCLRPEAGSLSRQRANGTRYVTRCSPQDDVSSSSEVDCIGVGSEIECVLPDDDEPSKVQPESAAEADGALPSIGLALALVSPFFFWGTSMVSMKEVLPATGPLFVGSIRLIPAGFALVAFALSQGRKLPSGGMAWVAISAFALVDGTCFQGFLAEGLTRTAAGLGSVIIDSQPITVAILAFLLYGESLGPFGPIGLLVAVLGLCLLELPQEGVDRLMGMDIDGFLAAFGGEEALSLWDRGEWWMLLAAQSMAVGTVMVRWVCKFVDPVMATGWHMIVGGVPLLALSLMREPSVYSHLGDLTSGDVGALVYTSFFGSAVSYGTFFYFASKGNLAKLSSLTFLTPMFAAAFGYLLLGETLTNLQLSGGNSV